MNRIAAQKEGMSLLKEAIAAGGYSFRAEGVSMRPSLRPGDELKIAPLGGRPVPGAILVWAAKDGLRAHRLLRIAGDGTYLCRGDNLWRKERVAPESALGQTAAVERAGSVLPEKAWRPRQTRSVEWKRAAYRTLYEAAYRTGIFSGRSDRRPRWGTNLKALLREGRA